MIKRLVSVSIRVLLKNTKKGSLKPLKQLPSFHRQQTKFGR